MNTNKLSRMVGCPVALIGGLALLMGVYFGLSAAVYTPIGFFFGVGELGDYDTWVDGLVNLFYHVLPGIGSAGLSLGVLLAGVLPLWTGRKMRA